MPSSSSHSPTITKEKTQLLAKVKVRKKQPKSFNSAPQVSEIIPVAKMEDTDLIAVSKVKRVANLC